MDILEAVTGARNGAAVDQLARQFGLEPEQATSAVAALMPAIAAGMQRNMASETGLSGLVAALSGGRHTKYLEEPNSLADPSTTADGNGILGHLLGSKDVSRQVAAEASQQTGIDTGVLKKMLPLVAALAMAGMARQAKPTAGDPRSAAPGLASMLGPLLGGGGSNMGSVAGILGGLLGSRGRK